MSLSKAEYRLHIPEQGRTQPPLHDLLRRAVPSLYEGEPYGGVTSREQFQHRAYAELSRPGLDGSPRIQNEDWQKVVAADELAESVHQQVQRADGTDYIDHPRTVATWYGSTYRVNWETLVATLLHDVPEDGDVDLETIRATYGDVVADFLFYLTKVPDPNDPKKTNKVATFRKHVESILHMPQASGGKVFDSLHNESTADGFKDEKKLIRKAVEWMNIGGSIAQIIGFLPEAQMIHDLGYVSLEHSAGRGNRVAKLLDMRDHCYAGIDRESLLKDITRLKRAGDIVDIELHQPGLYDLVQNMKDIDNPTREEFPMSIVLTIPDHRPSDDLYLREYKQEGTDVGAQHGLGLRASTAVSALLCSRSFIPPKDHNVGFIDAAEQGPMALVPKVEYTVYYQRYEGDPQPVPVQITVYRDSDYQLLTTPLTYLPGVARNLSVYDEKKYGANNRKAFRRRQFFAQQKQELIGNIVHQLATSVSTEEELVTHFFNTIPDSKIVIGINPRTGVRTERPIPAGATVMDYLLLIAPNSFWEMSHVRINGADVTDYSTILGQRDTIELTFEKGAYTVRPQWADAIQVADPQQMMKKRVFESVRGRIDYLSQREEYLKMNIHTNADYPNQFRRCQQERQALQLQCRERGVQRLLPYLTIMGTPGISAPLVARLLPQLATTSYLEEIGLNELDDTQVAHVGREMDAQLKTKLQQLITQLPLPALFSLYAPVEMQELLVQFPHLPQLLQSTLTQSLSQSPATAK